MDDAKTTTQEWHNSTQLQVSAKHDMGTRGKAQQCHGGCNAASNNLGLWAVACKVSRTAAVVALDERAGPGEAVIGRRDLQAVCVVLVCVVDQQRVSRCEAQG